MYKRLVEDALLSGALDPASLAAFTDEGLLHKLEGAGNPLLSALQQRRLFKRAAEWPSTEMDGTIAEWISASRANTRRAEDALAKKFRLRPGSLLVDFPEKTQMLGLDIPVL